ncbi:MAG: cytochrome c biogenesis protein CcsA [Acidimicrobiales bacterium]
MSQADTAPGTPGPADTSETTRSEPQTAPASTGGPRTRLLGAASLVGVAAVIVFALVLSPPEVSQRDAVRLMYVHLPSIAIMYISFAITLVGSIIYLRKSSVFWDLLAGAAAEIGVLFCAFTLITGSLWGKPTWGVYWQWDPRLTSTTILFVMYVGYLAVRRLDLPSAVRSRRAAVLGIVSFVNVFIVHYSVQWFRSLHQGATIGVDTKLDGLMLFTLFLSLVVGLMVFAWLLIHRFRLAWLQRQVEELGLARALAERRAETTRGAMGSGA